LSGFGIAAAADWVERVDPGTHRRIKGLRLVTAYGIAALLGRLPDIAGGLPDAGALATLAGGFALWASVSEGRATRALSSRDLLLLCVAAALGAAAMAVLWSPLAVFGRAGPELVLVSGAFLVGYLKRFGVLGAGLGSQLYIGELMGYDAKLTAADLPMLAVAAAIAALAAIVPRVLSGPAEHPITAPTTHALPPDGFGALPPELVMGLQGALASFIIIALDAAIGLEQAVWAITACVYVIANSALGTRQRVVRRIVGTAIGVPLGLACLPLAGAAPILLWIAAALAMIVYAMALPGRYDIACGAFAFTLMVTLAVSGDTTIAVLVARAWETLLGGAVGLAVAALVLPLRTDAAGEAAAAADTR
jgi:Fusaric acid resistance protein-like